MLVDSSIWIDHLRDGDASLKALLENGRVFTHTFIIGELALGNLRKRSLVLQLLQDLPQAIQADEGEVLDFIERNALSGRGIGYVDAHLLAAARLTSVKLWTHDRRLHEVALQLNLAA